MASKVPPAPYPVEQLTTGELATYIDQLKAALQKPLTQPERDLALMRLGAAQSHQNERQS